MFAKSIIIIVLKTMRELFDLLSEVGNVFQLFRVLADVPFVWHSTLARCTFMNATKAIIK